MRRLILSLIAVAFGSIICFAQAPKIVAYYHGDDMADYVTDFIELNTAVFEDLDNASSPWTFSAWKNASSNKDKIGAAGQRYGSEKSWAVTSIAPYDVYFYDKNKNLLTNDAQSYFNRDNISKAAYIKMVVPYNNFRLYIDGETYIQTIKAIDSRTQSTIIELSVGITKAMPAMPVKWTDFQFASQINQGVFNLYPMAPGDNYPALCSTSWTVDATGTPVAAAGTAVGIDLNKVFSPRYIGVTNFAYTPDDSYNANAGTSFAEALSLPNTFKMYVKNAAWNTSTKKWDTDVFSFGTVASNRYDLVKTSAPYDDDEFSLISHTKASEATRHATMITYTYPGVSTRIEDGKWVVCGDYEATDATYLFNTCFVDPFANVVQTTLPSGSSTYSFATEYGVTPPAAGIELKYFKLAGQYLNASPYADTLDQLLSSGIWKISGDVTIAAKNGLVYYNITNASTIVTDGAVKIANKFSDESGRPNRSVIQYLTIPLVNILGGTYDFTFSFVMDNGRGDPPAVEYELGDVNGNGRVDIGDAVSIVNHLVGKTPSTFMEYVADTNRNGRIDIGDAVNIVNYLVGKTAKITDTIEEKPDEKEPQ